MPDVPPMIKTVCMEEDIVADVVEVFVSSS